jgi:membrane protein DedA with SNARE-associated domain
VRASLPSINETGQMQHLLITYGYVAIFLLTILESACFPIPSEVTLALGGALCAPAFAAQSGDQPLNLLLVILIGVLGSLVGSYLTYVVGRTGGRAIVDKLGKYILLSHKDLDRSEAWFNKRGNVTVMVGRCVPFVRSIISLPAGIAEMEPVRFGIFSTIGITVWVSVLSLLGYEFYGQYEKWTKGISWAGYAIAAVVVVVVVIFLWHRYRAMKQDGTSPGRHTAR